MRRVIFGLLKLIEGVAFLYFSSWVGNVTGLSKLIDRLLNNISIYLVCILTIGAFFALVLFLIVIFNGWISQNWEWTDQIINIFKKHNNGKAKEM